MTFLGCQTTSVDLSDNESGLQEFNNFLGTEKSNALDQMVKSFDNFLQINYPDKKTQGKRTRAFLEQLATNYSPDTNWTFDTEKNIEILRQLEVSGMRREIWLYGYEDFEPKYNIHSLFVDNEDDTIAEYGILDIDLEEEELIPLTKRDSAQQSEFEERIRKREEELQQKRDSALWLNMWGQFLYGLAKYSKDTIITDYVEAQLAAGHISISIIIDGFLNYYTNKDYEKPLTKRVMVANLYGHLMRLDIERKINKARHANKS